MRIYLDTSVYNRPFDSQSQPRIRLESLAFTVILQMVETGDLELIVSSVNEFENSRSPYPTRKVWIDRWMGLAQMRCEVDGVIRQRAKDLEQQGLKAMDALHLACAEQAGAEWFFTCDDRLQRRYVNSKMTVANPVTFVLQVLGGF